LFGKTFGGYNKINSRDDNMHSITMAWGSTKNSKYQISGLENSVYCCFRSETLYFEEYQVSQPATAMLDRNLWYGRWYSNKNAKYQVYCRVY